VAVALSTIPQHHGAVTLELRASVRQGQWLERVTLAWNVVALAGSGLDSQIEIGASRVVL
jgi:hypothetical protein